MIARTAVQFCITYLLHLAALSITFETRFGFGADSILILVIFIPSLLLNTHKNKKVNGPTETSERDKSLKFSFALR
jgi:hypothetical protein